MELDWLMVDHYGIDYRWERAVRDRVARLGVIDDLADRRHVGELLLDQSFYADFETRYDHLVPPGCQLFLGPAHVLLRSEFETVRASLRERDGSVRRILVFFGADTKEQTAAAVRGLARLGRSDLSVDVVFTGTVEHLGRLQEACTGRPNIRLHSRVANMAELVGKADLGIGAGGTAMWERCYLGLPSIIVTFADNQLRTARDTAALGAIRYLGHFDELAANAYESAIAELLASPARMRQLTAASLQLVESGTAAVAQALFEHCATSH
jgi:UDP-2,4-diacetamido-2,4,6-trideoxy-beta-L-altropyranose hydrolase